jgi:hypothetical protein
MSNYPLRALACGASLLAAFPAAQAQTPGSQRTTSAVPQLGLDDPHAGPVTTGATRELRCRGKAGIPLRVQHDPSPRQPKLVAMELRYERPELKRSFGQEGMGLVDYGVSLQFLPGTCTWNAGGFPDIPPEPGFVYFDLERDAQAWRSPKDRDTTIAAAASFPDVASLTRYLSDPDRYWVFYVDDLTNVSISFGAWTRGGGLPPPAGDSGSTSHDLETSRDQRTSAAGTRTPVPPTGVEGPVGNASPERAGSGVASADGASTTIPVADPEKAPVDSSRPVVKPPSSSEPPAPEGAKRRRDERSRRQAQLESGIRDVTAGPGPRGVRLEFRVAGSDRVRVEFSTNRPEWDQREGLWNHAPGSSGPWHAEIDRRNGGGYQAVPRRDLEAGTRYYYLITVLGRKGSAPTRQRIGHFTATIGP